MSASEPQQSASPPTTSTRSRRTGQGRSRPRASLACMHCRTRKIKCDAQLKEAGIPCTSCSVLETECVVVRDADGRKTVYRQHVASLEDRIQYLESLMKQTLSSQGHTAPMNPQTPSRQEILDALPPLDLLAGTGKPSSPPCSQPNPTPPTSHAPGDQSPTRENLQSLGSISGELTRSVEPIANDASATYAQEPSTHGPNYEPDADEMMITYFDRPVDSHVQLFPRNLALDKLTPPEEDISDHVIIKDNQESAEFYGPTSNPYVRRPDEKDTVILMEQDTEAVVNVDSYTVRKHLLGSFWKVQPLSISLVDEELFMSHRIHGTRSWYYSELLEYAILACASRKSTSAAVRRLGGEYAERAKLQIMREMEDPNIATIQSLLVLSDFEATRGRARLGYSLAGMGYRLLYDLGLHQDKSGLVKQGRLTKSEAQLYRDLFLGAFVTDKLWSLYLGRPDTIPVTALSRVRGGEESAMNGPNTDILHSRVNLCIRISEISDVLNSAEAEPLLNDETIARLCEIDTSVAALFVSLPSSLSCDKEHISELNINAYALHIHTHGIRITIHTQLSQAYCRQRVATRGDANTAWTHSEALQQSRALMHESAVYIAQLVTTFEQILGTENIITAMLDMMYLAATVLISHILSAYQENPATPLDKDLHLLRSLASVMQDVQKHLPVSAAMIRTLSSAVGATPLEGTFGPHYEGRRTSSYTMPLTQILPTPISEVSFNSHNGSGAMDWTAFDGDMRGTRGWWSNDQSVNPMPSWYFSPPC